MTRNVNTSVFWFVTTFVFVDSTECFYTEAEYGRFYQILIHFYKAECHGIPKTHSVRMGFDRI